MILGIGNDLIDIRRIEASIERFGARFEDRMFTAKEREKAHSRSNAGSKTIAATPAALATVTNVIAKENGNISNFKIVNRSNDFFEILVDIEVHDLRHLNNIIANLRSKEVVQNVERYQT